MRIGELAIRAGVNVQTIRFYERRRLLRAPARTPSGYRDYDLTDLEALRFIKWSQRLGFTLKEAKQLLQLHSAILSLPSVRGGAGELDSIVHMARQKLAAIEGKMQFLRAIRREIVSAIKHLQRPAPVCPASKQAALSRAPLTSHRKSS
jgi:DNA-binding transcriptional MerR regulator